MARVFLSYRRTDGPYAVGWIHERLAGRGDVTEVKRSFQDAELRCGDDFPAALSAEIASCDVLLAVIGPTWRGARDDGGHRIADPDDWVGRELSEALEAGKRILPVLVGGAPPLSADELRPEHRALADLHAVAFDREDDLDALVAHLQSHLDEIDTERATLAGLARPIELESPRIPLPVVAAALLAGAAGAALGWWMTTGELHVDLPAGELEVVRDRQRQWGAMAAIEVGLWSLLGVVGHHYFWRHFAGRVRIRWRPVLTTIAVAFAVMGVTILAFNTPPPVDLGRPRMWALLFLSVILLLPWILTWLGSSWTEPTVERHRLGERARNIGELRRAGNISTVVLAVAGTPAVLVTASLARLVDVADTTTGSAAEQAYFLVLWGLSLSGLFLAGRLWAGSKLRSDSIALSSDLAELPPDYRRHATAHLVGDRIAPPTWVLVLVAIPTAVGIVVAFLI